MPSKLGKPASRQNVRNPWGLTEREVDLLDEFRRTGTVKRATERMRVTKNTADSYMRRAKAKMGLKGEGSSNRALAAFVEWRVTDGKGVPA